MDYIWFPWTNFTQHQNLLRWMFPFILLLRYLFILKWRWLLTWGINSSFLEKHTFQYYFPWLQVHVYCCDKSHCWYRMWKVKAFQSYLTSRATVIALDSQTLDHPFQDWTQLVMSLCQCWEKRMLWWSREYWKVQQFLRPRGSSGIYKQDKIITLSKSQINI